MISFFIVSSGFNIFNTFINLYDQEFILNHRRPYDLNEIVNSGISCACAKSKLFENKETY